MTWLDTVYNKVNDTVKDQDVFGQPIPLNYDGDDTFKSSPGGLLSVMMLITMLGYFVLKLKFMINQEEWALIQQNVQTKRAELMQPLLFSDQKKV